MRTMYPVSGGRFINEQDVALQRRTLFLGDQIAGTLFGGEDPVGKEILLNGTPFTVVGTMKSKMQTSMNNGPDAERAIIPHSTLKNMIGKHNLNSTMIRHATQE